MTRLPRILAITSALFVTGGLLGAFAGAAVASLIAILLGPRAGLDLELLGIGATFGAPLGAVLLPITAWLLMRHIPLGRAFAGTAAGTVAGGLVGWFLPVGENIVARTLIAGVVGFVIAVFLLRRSAAGTQSGADARAV